MAETLTDAEREQLDTLRRYDVRESDENAVALGSLEGKGFARPDKFPASGGVPARCFWSITPAGRAALIEAAVAERFAEFDHLSGRLEVEGISVALDELGRIIRDQERRIAELEMRGGS